MLAAKNFKKKTRLGRRSGSGSAGSWRGSREEEDKLKIKLGKRLREVTAYLDTD